MTDATPTTAPASNSAPPAAAPAAPPTLFGGGGAPGITTPAGAPAPASQAPTAGQPPVDPTASTDPWSKWAPDRRGFFENKGWLKDGKLDVDALADSYQQLEKFKGAPPDETFRLSKTPTPDEMSRIHKKLGVPETPEGYGLKPAEGQDPQLLQEIAKTAHENKVTPQQLQALLKLNQGLFQRQQADAQRQESAAFERDGQELAREWGNADLQNRAIARRAANLDAFQKFGLDEGFWANAAKYPGVGPGKIARALHALGVGLGEDRFVAGDGGIGTGGQRAHTPESAEARLQEIERNPALRKAYLNKTDAALVQEVEALNKAILRVR